jgi:YfiH family protein
MLILNAPALQGSSPAHGFFGRMGGVSTGIYASLNCGLGSKDEPEAVTENRRRVLDALANGGPAQLVTCYQIHSPTTVVVTEPWAPGMSPQADAMVTKARGIALGILTADCAPVLLHDQEAGVIGAAHAGWNGAFSGVIESVVAAMTHLGAARAQIRAAIGPCIGQDAYEVGPEFAQRFRERDASFTRFFRPSTRANHWQFALERFVAFRLEEAGIGTIDPLNTCTYAREADFFSYRRTVHRAEPDYGRQLSVILLKD